MIAPVMKKYLDAYVGKEFDTVFGLIMRFITTLPPAGFTSFGTERDFVLLTISSSSKPR